MVTWRGRFEILSAETDLQLKRKDAGNDNRSELKASKDALVEFTRKYESAGSPNKDMEMPPTPDDPAADQ